MPLFDSELSPKMGTITSMPLKTPVIVNVLQPSYEPPDVHVGIQTIPEQCPTKHSFRTQKKCDTHTKKHLEFFCQNHDKVACDICIQIFHRQCSGVQKITDLASRIDNSEELQKTKEHLEDIERMHEENVKIVARETLAMDTVYKEALLDITRVLNQLYERDRSNLEKITNTSILIKDEIHALKKGLDKKDDIHKFLTMKKAAEEVKKFEDSLMLVRRDARITRYGFVPREKSGENSSRFEKEMIGQICTFPKQLKKFTIETQSDRHHCSVSGLILLPGDRLVVVDNGNRKVKLFALTTRSLIVEVAMDTAPLMITPINDEMVAMTSAMEKRVYVLSVKDGINIDRHFELGGLSQNIAFSDGQYLVSYSDSEKLQILDENGHESTTIETIATNLIEQELNRPKAVTFVPTSGKPKFFLQANCAENKVTRMNFNGDVISQFEADDMKYPIDFAHGKDGSVYVCCRGSDNIFNLSQDLAVGHVILDEDNGLVSPWCITVCKEQSILYIGSYGGKHIQVFKV